MIFILYIFIGSMTGLFAGMLGIGGGIIIVPSLAMIFKHYYGYSNQYMHLASGTSLSIMIFTAISAVRKNNKQKRIVWPIFYRIIPWIIVGIITGALIANYLNSFILSIIFGLITLSFAINMILGIFNSRNEKDKRSNPTLKKPLPAIIGSIIGLKSGLLGIGGGIISVPFLHSCGVPLKKATGTSSAFTLPISIIGTISFIVFGIMSNHNIPFTLGYVYWPVALTIIPCTIFFAPIGCTLSYKMNTKWLKVIFIIFLIIVSYKMLILPLLKALA